MRSLWEWWKRIGKRIGDIQARIILVLFYFIVVGPFALIMRLGDDPLAIRGKSPRGWQPKSESNAMQMDRARSQF
jgi:hypothetical protein